MNRVGTPVGRAKSRGAALLALVVVVVMAAIAFMVADLEEQRSELRRERKQLVTLSEARAALIAFAVVRRCQAGSGSALDQTPCPSPANAAVQGAAAATCGTASSGRLPWFTIGTGPIRDNSGECLWMTRDLTPSHRFVEIVAPGQALPGQSRPGQNNRICGQNDSPANYLEGENDVSVRVSEAEINAAAAGCP